MFKRFSWVFLAMALVALPTFINAAGGSGGGGGTVKPFEARVTGYISAIDYTNGVIMVGQSYYGSVRSRSTPTPRSRSMPSMAATWTS